MAYPPKYAVNSGIQSDIQLTSVVESGTTKANRHIKDVAPTLPDVNRREVMVHITQQRGEFHLDPLGQVVSHTGLKVSERIRAW